MPQLDDGFLDFVLDQLRDLEGVRSRRMFGAFGLYQHDDFFAIVDGGRLYLRTSDDTRPEFEARGMKPFVPTPKQVLKNYYEVPVEVLEDDTLLREWSRRAVAAQRAARR